MTTSSPFPKIADYGLIGDGRTAALISNRGSLDWCCFPRFDSPSYFSSILDSKKGGSFSIAPVGPFQSTQSYLNDTNILVTEFHTPTGKARILDCFTVTNEENKTHQLWPNHEILRIVEGVSGEITFRLHYEPRPHYGRNPAWLKKQGEIGICVHHQSTLLLLRSTIPNEQIILGTNCAYANTNFTVKPEKQVTFSLIFDDIAPAVIPPLGAPSLERFEQTKLYWQNWAGQCQYQGLYSEYVRRSALTLKLLLFAPSGAIVAAPTTSLPEWIGGPRNWDYRYCWLRDASFTVRALVQLGYYDEADSFVSWLMYTTRLTRPRLQVVYSIYGQTRLKEKNLGWLRGYFHSKPVRVGNAADQQLQTDIYGEVLDAIYTVLPHEAYIDKETRHFILGMGDAVCALWDQPDEGIWEVRSGKHQHTHSKVMAWVALDRLIKISKHYQWKAPIERFESVSKKLREAIETHGYNSEIGAYTGVFGSKVLDASLLVMPLVGYCDASSPRMISTCKAICRDLSTRGLIYRYRNHHDGVPGSEGTFGLCNFWMVENKAKTGALAEAQDWFNSLLKHGNPVRLWSEEIHPETFDYLGNYPQAFTHIGLINAAITLSACQALKEAG